jgi:hypothetical protein
LTIVFKSPGKRGLRTKKEKLSGDLAGIRAELTDAKAEGQ